MDLSSSAQDFPVQGSPQLPSFVGDHQTARYEARRRAFEHVQKLTQMGLHAEAHRHWQQAISADESYEAC